MQLLSKRVSDRVTTIWAIATAICGMGIVPVWGQEVPPPNIIIETESPDSESVTPSDITDETTLNAWKRVRLIHSLAKHQGSIDSVVFSPDSSILISGGGSNDSQMIFWSVETGKRLDRIRAQKTAVLAMAIDPNSNVLASSGEDAEIHLWDWESGKYRATLLQHNASVTSLNIAPDGKTLISGASDGIKVWDLTTFPYSPLYNLTRLGNSTNKIAINPNGYLLASGNDDGKVKFWNLRTGTFISEFAPHKEPISGIAFSIDGDILITASGDRTIKLWDLESGQLLQELTGHTRAVLTMALHPYKNILATGGKDGIILWNLEEGKILTRLEESDGWIQSLAFSPNGRYLASGSYDSIVRIWEDALSNF